MTTSKSVVNVLTSKFDANVVRQLGSQASEALLGIDTIKGLALKLGEMLETLASIRRRKRCLLLCIRHYRKA